MKVIEVPANSLETVTAVKGYAEGICLVIMLIRKGIPSFKSPEAKGALASLADTLEGDLEKLLKNYVKAQEDQQVRKDTGENVVWH